MGVRSFYIDALPEAALRHRDRRAVVAVDVFRATTSIVTALAMGHRVFPVGSIEAAHRLAAEVPGAFLVGEEGGDIPAGFDINNSPTLLERLGHRRPIVMLSSAGTKLIAHAQGAPAVYLACLRNFQAVVPALTDHHEVALIGAGSRGEPRAEDQMVCAEIGRALLARGFEVGDAATADQLAAYPELALEPLRAGPSASYLRRSQQAYDIEFVLGHIGDIDLVVTCDGHEATAFSLETDPEPVLARG